MARHFENIQCGAERERLWSRKQMLRLVTAQQPPRWLEQISVDIVSHTYNKDKIGRIEVEKVQAVDE